MPHTPLVQSVSDTGAANDGNLRLAVICVVSAMMMIAVVDNYVSRVATLSGLWQFHALRSGIAVPLIAVAWLLGMGRLRPNRLWAVILRSSLTATAMMFYFGSLGMMTISQALAGLFTAPIWVLLISVVFLGLRIGPVRIFAIFLGFAGVMLVLQPDRDLLQPGFVFPMMAGLVYALAGLATRRLCAREDALSLLLGTFMAMGLIGCAGLFWFHGSDTGFLTRGWTPLTPTLLGIIAAQCCGALVGVYLLIRAYQLAETTIVAVFEYALMVFGPAYAWIVFGDALGPLAMLGLCAIAVAAVLITRRGTAA